MKKTVLLFLIAFTGITSIQAQDGVKFGVKAGANFANLVGDTDGIDGRTGLHVGGVINVGINEWLAIQPEVIYSMQGYSGEEMGVDFTGKLDYVNIPIMADFTIAEGFSLQGGPQIGINVTSKEEAGDIEVESDAESLDIGTGIGAQYELPMGLFFQARYMVGLTDVFDTDGEFSNKNSVISLSVGWFFN